MPGCGKRTGERETCTIKDSNSRMADLRQGCARANHTHHKSDEGTKWLHVSGSLVAGHSRMRCPAEWPVRTGAPPAHQPPRPCGWCTSPRSVPTSRIVKSLPHQLTTFQGQALIVAHCPQTSPVCRSVSRTALPRSPRAYSTSTANPFSRHSRSSQPCRSGSADRCSSKRPACGTGSMRWAAIRSGDRIIRNRKPDWD
jgi:hypothetical protein